MKIGLQMRLFIFKVCQSKEVLPDGEIKGNAHRHQSDAHGDEYSSPQLFAEGKPFSLAKITGYGVLLFLHVALEAVKPFDVAFRNTVVFAQICAHNRVNIGVADKITQNLVPVGSQTNIVKTLHILVNTADHYAEFMTAELVKLYEFIKKCFVYLLAHSSSAFRVYSAAYKCGIYILQHLKSFCNSFLKIKKFFRF